MWNITARVCHAVNNNELQKLDLSMRHRNKHKTVFLHLLCLEKIRTNRTYMHKSWHAKQCLGHWLSILQMIIGIQLKNMVWNHITLRHCLKTYQTLCCLLWLVSLFNVSKITKVQRPSRLCFNIIFLTLRRLLPAAFKQNIAKLFKSFCSEDFFRY